ncbi:hypothetical protein [Marinobacter sp.]|uniref:hypothetical protein n=1 Tax=Marinobacter sp. TaxID=50741 RepID=UPI00260AD535|nr:hypothetical protein [Marinobacter sp.]
MSLKAIILAAAITPAVADDSAGVFQLEPHAHESITQSGPSRAEALTERAGIFLRKAATYLNTHELVGNPDLPKKYRDILPHEAFGKFKESFKDVLREKLRED